MPAPDCATCGGRHGDDPCPALVTGPAHFAPVSPPLALETTTPSTDPPAVSPRAGSSMGLAPGAVLQGRYRIVRKLGEGGMGSVHEVEHVLVGRRFALKLLHATLARDADHVARFHREARAAAAVGDPHVVDVVDMGVLDDGSPFLVMELLDGPSLRAELDRAGALPVARVLSLARQCCGALAAVHAKGVIHRDLKPDNVLLVRDRDGVERVKIVDFGISKLVAAAGELVTTARTRTGQMLGTPYYMAPEQLRAERDLDGRTDVWAMGVMLYEMLTGRRPFEAPTMAMLAIEVLQQTPPSPSALRADVPAALERVVSKALEKDRTDRFASMSELADALEAIETGSSPSTRSLGSRPAADGIVRAPRAATTESSVSRYVPWMIAGIVSFAAFAWMLRPGDASGPPAHRGADENLRLSASATRERHDTTSRAPPASTASSDGLPNTGAVAAPSDDASLSTIAATTDDAGARATIQAPAKRPAARSRTSDEPVRESPSRPVETTPALDAPPTRSVSVRNGLRAEVEVTFECEGDRRVVRVGAGATRTIALPPVVCRVDCTSPAVIPRCRRRLAPTDRALEVLL